MSPHNIESKSFVLYDETDFKTESPMSLLAALQKDTKSKSLIRDKYRINRKNVKLEGARSRSSGPRQVEPINTKMQQMIAESCKRVAALQKDTKICHCGIA